MAHPINYDITQRKSLFICGYNVTIAKRGNVILVRVDDYVYKGVKEIVEDASSLVDVMRVIKWKKTYLGIA